VRKLFFVASSVALSTAAFAAMTSTTTKLDVKAKMRMPKAPTIALKTFPGKIVKEEIGVGKGR
jgi:hypothetical protein